MLQVIGWSFLAFLAICVLVILITMIWVNIWNAKVLERPDPPSEETKGPFTRPEASANPSTRYPRHRHMVSGTIYETSNPEYEGILPVRVEGVSPGQLSEELDILREMLEVEHGVGISNFVHELIVHEPISERQAAPGVVVRTLQEKESLSLPRAKQDPKPKETKVKHKSRYQRDPVI